MNPIRNPLVLLHLAAQRLWRNRRFLGILLCLWLASAGIYRFILDPLIFAPQLERLRAAAPEPGESIDTPSKGVVIDSGGLAGEGPQYWVWRALPQFRPVDLHLGYSAWPVSILALGALAGALITLWFSRPQWLPPETHQRLVWPIYLTLGGFLVMAAYSGFAFASVLLRHTGELSTRAVVLSALLPVFSYPFLAFATAPLTALLWHIVSQVGSGRYWNLRHSIVGAIRSWPSIGWLNVILYLPILMSILPFTIRLLAHTMDFMPYRCQAVWDLAIWAATVLPIVLLFVPWIVLAERVNFWPAVVRNFQLIRSRWRDLLVLLLRWLVVIVPVYALLSTGASVTVHNTALQTLLSLTRSTIELMVLVTIVVLYTKLRDAEHKALVTQSPVAAD